MIENDPSHGLIFREFETKGRLHHSPPKDMHLDLIPRKKKQTFTNQRENNGQY